MRRTHRCYAVQNARVVPYLLLQSDRCTCIGPPTVLGKADHLLSTCSLTGSPDAHFPLRPPLLGFALNRFPVGRTRTPAEPPSASSCVVARPGASKRAPLAVSSSRPVDIMAGHFVAGRPAALSRRRLRGCRVYVCCFIVAGWKLDYHAWSNTMLHGLARLLPAFVKVPTLIRRRHCSDGGPLGATGGAALSTVGHCL